MAIDSFVKLVVLLIHLIQSLKDYIIHCRFHQYHHTCKHQYGQKDNAISHVKNIYLYICP